MNRLSAAAHALAASSISLLLLASLAAPAMAAWPVDGRALCDTTTDQLYQTIVSDGAGGAIIAWSDYRGGTGDDIFAQHVLATGAPDPAWPAEGQAICRAIYDQFYPAIASDGAGGAIVTWYDSRSGTDFDIYAQHVLASGAADPAWPVDGRALTTAAGDQTRPSIVSDGTGGAIVAWYGKPDYSISDVYAQHVLASGAVDPAWPANGTALCTAANDQQYTTIASDGAGGAIVTWEDRRSGTYYDIYAQRVQASGAVDPAWPANGRALCTAANSQLDPAIVSDGAGGAIITWNDFRNSFSDVYAQRVLASGAVDPAWPADGRALSSAAGHQQNVAIAPDGAGGAIVTWSDSRGADYDIYAQHVRLSGVVDPAWPVDGRALCTATNIQQYPSIVSDGAGGAVVTWTDYRDLATTSSDIYAQRVRASGLVDPAWPVDGRALCTQPNYQYQQVIATDGAGGAIVTWTDLRHNGTTGADTYAQRVGSDGTIGGTVTSVAEGSAPVGLSFAAPSPNPAGVSAALSFVLPRASDVRLAVYDTAGRLVRELARGTRPAGEQVVRWDLRDSNGHATSAGIYFARLEVEGSPLVRKMAVIR